ncbi:MAG TPA: 2-iminoacetate synthase ThiH [bacterium]|nr:2-iminoacetate synthase ThiH [bacterium]
MSFREHLAGIPVDELIDAAHRSGPRDVERAISRETPDLADFAALLSPSADASLEEIAERARKTTLQRFGRTVQLYAPLYVSNECVETCTYCSFARSNPVPRRTLTVEEAESEARILLRRGFRHLLLVSGEHPRHVSPEYLESVIAALHPVTPSLSVEVQPQTADVYARWCGAGAEGLVVYQETYDREAYAQVHLAGKKKNYDWRLDTPDRGAAGGMKRLGIGALLGLADWRLEAVHLAVHARYLMRRYWRTFVTVSFPRLRKAAFAIEARRAVSDRDLARVICAFRLFLPDVGLVLSTRESPAFRDGMLGLGVTQVSAGSRTDPGGYSRPEEAEKQFETEDTRTAEEVSEAIRARGFDPVWKDWEAALSG